MDIILIAGGYISDCNVLYSDNPSRAYLARPLSANCNKYPAYYNPIEVGAQLPTSAVNVALLAFAAAGAPCSNRLILTAGRSAANSQQLPANDMTDGRLTVT